MHAAVTIFTLNADKKKNSFQVKGGDDFIACKNDCDGGLFFFFLLYQTHKPISSLLLNQLAPPKARLVPKPAVQRSFHTHDISHET